LRKAVHLSIAGVILVSIALTIAMFSFFDNFGTPEAKQKSFYVGVTYCGNSVSEANQLIDIVKDYTNLFVVASGELQAEPNKMIEICDYAVKSGLHVMGYFGALDYNQEYVQTFVDTAISRWGSLFLGLYYGDEPGGKILDSNLVLLRNEEFGENITRQPESIMVTKSDGTRISYLNNSECSIITVFHDDRAASTYWRSNQNGTLTVMSEAEFMTYNFREDGIIERASKENVTLLNDKKDDPLLSFYSDLVAAKPFQTYNETAARLVDHCQSTTEWLRNQSVPLLTADYGLYWFDYLGGYDVVLAEFGWNNTIAQEIGLVRGAAKLQNKTWGAIVTWKYTQKPYLASGDEMYAQMKTVYQAGAEYVVIFNYPMLEGNPYGVMQEEHFQALERFWVEVVQNPNVENGEVEAEAALILPEDYGWGMRTSNDTIWGMWRPDDKSPQVWATLQNALATYGARLDIIYDDPTYPYQGKYSQIIYWDRQIVR
jgi:hypothetical protein